MLDSFVLVSLDLTLSSVGVFDVPSSCIGRERQDHAADPSLVWGVRFDSDWKP